MIHNSHSMDRLAHELKKLPGIGEKSALRLAFYLARHPDLMGSLADALSMVRERLRLCSVCCTLTEDDPCPTCSSRRDETTICVVQEPQDILAVERTGTFSGRYHVLHGVLSPIHGMTPERLTINQLLRRLEQGTIREVILATNFTVEGEATAHYLSQVIREKGVKVTRLAHGIPTGGDLEFLDPLTVRYALAERREVDNP
ncbi:MAG: recombination mediator RecR [Desulfuromonadia bacterium]